MRQFQHVFQAQTKSFDDDFDSDPEDEIPPQPSKSKPATVKDEEDDDSDFEDPDLIEVPGGGSSLQTLKKLQSGDSSMPTFGGTKL